MRTRVDVEPPFVHGEVAPGFERVRETFAENFSRRGELGAACAVYHRGRKVVDLWGGHADPDRRTPWDRDTLVLVFCVTKGVAAMTVALAHARGLFDYDAPMADYWPEFAAAGKQAVTVRQLLAHQAGLPGVDKPLTPALLADPDGLATVLARQRPAWPPGTRHGYHSITLGLYESELIRRTDPAGRRLGQYFRDEIATPLDLEFYIGTPPTVPEERIAGMRAFGAWTILSHPNIFPPAFLLAAACPGTRTRGWINNPRLRTHDDLGRPPLRGVELAAANGIGQVRDVAKLYGAFATGARDLGVDDRTYNEITAEPVPPTESSRDAVLRVDTSYSLGFWKPTPTWRFGSDHTAYGTPGAGGAFAFADPYTQIGFAYAPNRLGLHWWDDPREKALRRAVYTSIAQ